MCQQNFKSRQPLPRLVGRAGLVICALFGVGVFFAMTGPTALRAQTSSKQFIGAKITLAESGRAPVEISLPEGKQLPVSSFFEEYRKAFPLSIDNQMAEVQIFKDALGQTHHRFNQRYKGIEVEGFQFILHERKGWVFNANGELVHGLDVDVTPALSEQQALQSARAYLHAESYMWENESQEAFLKKEQDDENATFYPKGELTITSGRQEPLPKNFRLAYRFDIYAEKPLGRYDVYVDAKTGEVIDSVNRIYDVDVPGTGATLYNGSRGITIDRFKENPVQYRLQEAGAGEWKGIRTFDMQNGTNFSKAVDFVDTDTDFTASNAQAGVSAHWGAEKTFDYFLDRHGANSFDRNGARINSYVHFKKKLANAEWDGSRMRFGDGDGANTSAWVSLDIVGHEFTHGLTQYSAGLKYRNESGALNESFSDIFGALVEFYAEGASGDWLIAEDIYVNKGQFLRSMQTPNAAGQPDTYLGGFWYAGSADNGGVHTNSGVQNHWFYLLSQGGSGTNDHGRPYNFTGIGMNDAAKIAYLTLTAYLISNSNYASARTGSINAAIAWFGNGSSQHQAVQNAWDAVGVYDTATPALYINDVTVREGFFGTGFALFTVGLTNLSNRQITVEFKTADGTATFIPGKDYSSTSGRFIFSPGKFMDTFVVPITDDKIQEPNETFFVNLSNPTNAAISDGQGVCTIIDNDDTPLVFITEAKVPEAEADTTLAFFVVTLTNPSSQVVTVDYATADVTAADSSDYTAGSGTLSFPSGVTARAIYVKYNDDRFDEIDETFLVKLSNLSSNAAFAKSQGEGTIIDDDLPPSLSIGDVTVREVDAGTTDAEFAVTLSIASGKVVTVDYTTADSTATDSTDYVARSETITFPSGTSEVIIPVAYNDDAINEPDETFFVNLSNPINATLADSQGVATIIDNDDPPAISINDVTVTEAGADTSAAVFTITLSTPSSQVVTVDYATVDGTATAGSDYDTTYATVTFPPGTTAQIITVVYNNDVLDEADETFFVDLSNPSNATIDDYQGQGTIIDDDPAPAISINDVSVTEGNTGTVNANFTASLSAASGLQVTVNYATANETATAGSDYVASSGTVTFPAGSTTQTISVVVNGDALPEPTETFFINLSNAVNATIADAQGQGTINDDDALPSISISDVSVTEGNTGTVNANFTASLSAASGLQVTVNYATANGTATSGSDYVTGSGTVTFPAGSTTQTISIAVNGDALDEPNETFFVNLSTAVNATIADAQGVCTINDDDASPAISINDVTVLEGASGTDDAFFTVTLSAPSGQVVTVNYATANGTATAGSDYIAASGTVTFSPGTTSQFIIVQYNSDVLYELDETFLVNLSSPTNATIADGQGVCTMTNDDPLPSISINDVTVGEGAGNAFFTVTLDAASGQEATVDYFTSDGTAEAGIDYWDTSGRLTFPPGTTSQTIVVAIIDDDIEEPDETFLVYLHSPNYGIVTDGEGVGTIGDEVLAMMVLNPIDIADADFNQPITDFGTAPLRKLSQAGPALNSFLKFVVSGVNGPVQSAKLRLKATEAGNQVDGVFLVSNDYRGTSTPWTESGLTCNNAPSISGNPLIPAGSVTVGQWIEFDVTAAVAGNGAISFGLKNASVASVKDNSWEGAEAPELVIRFLPNAPTAAKTAEELKNEVLAATLPERLELSPNYPNPFNPQTTIAYALPEAAPVRLAIYDLLGRVVRMLVDETQSAGYTRVIWDGRNELGQTVGTGIYLYQLQVGRQQLVRRMVFQK